MERAVLLQLGSRITRCVARAREEYASNPDTFAADITRQDAAIMNIVRACSSALDLGRYVGWKMQLGEPHDLCDVFNVLRDGGWIDAELADNLQHVVRFKDKAIRDDLALLWPETVEVITRHLGEFLRYTEAVLQKDDAQGRAR
ncbi:DUF86 domain-containing protein [uncultured Sphaerotilus sp.]|uniref:type VII toxin-antitoxin system HepT family RNase toxin n=1 Tax=uncultured Sphaerotilus sp. TaxID=474984 RepID=UPI0030CA1553